MLVETKARVGVFAIALGAYLPQFPSLVPEFEGQYEAFKKTIPDSVEFIGPFAFSVMEKLKKITVPDSVTNFGECWLSSSENVTVFCSEKSTAHEYAEANNIKVSITD